MPAEWELHDATWLSWPKNPETFPPSIISKVEGAYCQMASALCSDEKVKMLVDNEKEERRVEGILHSYGISSNNILFLRISTCDVWIRDYGPTFLLNKKTGGKAAVRWKFNAWGDKYEDLAQDDAAGGQMADWLEKSEVRTFRPGIVMEGGSIDSDGSGTILTTEQCLLNKNRNPRLSKQQIEQCLHDCLGSSKIIWLKQGIEGDDTDGHVDDFARFVGKGKAVCAQEGSKKDENFSVLEGAAKTLGEAGLEVLRLPMPSPLIDEQENRRLPASHANFYIGNKCVLLPVFGGRSDGVAGEMLQQCFPGRQIVEIPARELVYGYGGVHCVTQQEPKAGR